MTATEKQLLERCMEGDATSWETFTRRYSPVIFSAIYATIKRYSLTLPPEDTNDLHQQILLSLLEKDCRKLKQYRGINGCSLSTWLGVVVVRTTINFIKTNSRKTRNTLSIEEMKFEVRGNEGEVSKNISAKQETEELREIIREELKPREQLFLRLHFEKELGMAEVAAMMKISRNAAYVLKTRTLAKIREIYCKDPLLKLSI